MLAPEFATRMVNRHFESLLSVANPVSSIVPLTDWKEKYEIAPWMIKVEPDSNNRLNKTSAADCFQIRSISEQRFVKKIGSVSESIMDEIRIGLSKVLSIECE